MLSVCIGLIVTAASLWGLIMWRNDFLIVMRGLVPICFMFGGIVAVIAGAVGWRENKKK